MVRAKIQTFDIEPVLAENSLQIAVNDAGDSNDTDTICRDLLSIPAQEPQCAPNCGCGGFEVQGQWPGCQPPVTWFRAQLMAYLTLSAVTTSAISLTVKDNSAEIKTAITHLLRAITLSFQK